MQPLTIKLLRDLRRLWAQVLAIALVMAAGVATLLLGVGAHRSLSETRSAYYDSNRFADIFASVTRAPLSMATQIEAIDGVAAVEPRIVEISLTDIEGVTEPGSVLIVSLPDHHEPLLNRLYLRTGRMPEPGSTAEAVISEGFAKANDLVPGDHFAALINGSRRKLTVTGIALSPEFIYAIGPGDLMPDERRFGIAWMPETALAAAFDLEGAFSNIVIKLVPGTPERPVINAVDDLLARYGGVGAHGRKDQISHGFLDAELKQLEAMSRLLPPIFLIVAAFLVNMTLGRLVALEREQIGLLKAIGYSSFAIVRHYNAFVAAIAAIGITIGFGAGTWLGIGMASLYARFFSFPFLVFSRSPDIYAIAAIVTLVAAIAGATRAVASVSFLPPAVAMTPPAPAQYQRLFRGYMDLSGRFSQAHVMAARHLLRWPARTASSVTGVAFSVSILVGSLWSFGSIEKMIDVTFTRTERQHATISFAEPLPIGALYAAGKLPGVMHAEPYRSVAVKFRNGHRERRLALSGKPEGASLSRVLDTNLEPVSFPGNGVVVSRALADILELRSGDRVEIELMEGDRRTVTETVAAINEGYLGLTAFMDLDAMNRMLREGAMISGVHVSLDEAQAEAFFTAAKSTPAASFMALQKISLRKFRETLAQNITVMVTVYVVLAAIIAFGVVYNFARISLSEQGRELASLRVIGFTRGEVSRLLLGELAVIVLLAQPLGWIIGFGFATAMVEGFATELYRVPLVIGPEVYAWSSMVVIGAAILSALLVRRRIDRLDLIAVLKTRE